MSGWRQWSVARFRAYAGYFIGFLAVIAIGGASLVGAKTEAPAAPTFQTQDAGEGEKIGHEVENHGRCVSAAARAAKDAGLIGPDRGAFMKAVAADESLVADKEGDCDVTEPLEAALAAQAEREPAGNKPADAGPPDKGEDHPSSTAPGHNKG